jgi:two-component sensor histidine kinase
MAIIQRKLYDGNNLSAINLPDFIPELAEAVFLSCGYENAAQKYVIGRISLDVDRTMSLGLIITELAINACKYAFPDNEMPLFEVNCMQMENAIELTVKDNGPGLDVTTIKNFDPVTQHFKGSTFGMKLLELQVSQLYGDFEFRNEQGAVFSMKFKK